MNEAIVVISLSQATRIAAKAIENIAFQLDDKQFLNATFELGELRQLGARIESEAYILMQVVHDLEWQAKQRKAP